MRLSHPPAGLSSAEGLAALALCVAPTPERLDPGLRRVLSARIATKAPARSSGLLRLDSWTVLADDPAAASGTFTWSPRTARRILGSPAARRVLSGASTSPLAAVRAEVDDVIRRAATARVRPGSLGSWLGEAPLAALAAVIAEAAGYATDLITLLDYDQLGDRALVGAPDPIWAVPGAPWVSLRARRDLEIILDAQRQTRALVCLRPGRPKSAAVDDLSLVALVDALTHPSAPLPTRVLGVWPSCGRAVSLEVSPEVTRRAARLVVHALDVRRTGASVRSAA